ncbi:MAG: hypothetical protein QXI32_02890 [Candidatus Bathyarchaeia archaeon]
MLSEICKRLLRILVNGVAFFFMMTVMTIVFPDVLFLIRQIPTQGLSYKSAIGLLLVVITTFLGLRVMIDLIRLVDITSEYLLVHIPGLRQDRRISLMKAIKELAIVVILIIAATSISPILAHIPDIGLWLDLGFSITLAGLSIILIYDAGRTLYAVFQSWIELILDRFSGDKV